MGFIGKISKQKRNATLKKHLIDLDDSIQEVYDISVENLKQIESKKQKKIFDEYKSYQQKILDEFNKGINLQKDKMNTYKFSLYKKIINF